MIDGKREPSERIKKTIIKMLGNELNYQNAFRDWYLSEIEELATAQKIQGGHFYDLTFLNFVMGMCTVMNAKSNFNKSYKFGDMGLPQ